VGRGARCACLEDVKLERESVGRHKHVVNTQGRGAAWRDFPLLTRIFSLRCVLTHSDSPLSACVVLATQRSRDVSSGSASISGTPSGRSDLDVSAPVRHPGTTLLVSPGAVEVFTVRQKRRKQSYTRSIVVTVRRRLRIT